MSLLTAFTNQLTNLMTELHELYPKDTDIETKRTAIEFIKKTNPRLLANGFKKYVYPYKSKIMNKDEMFFKNNNYDKEVDTSRPDIVKTIVTLKKYWDEIGENNRNTIWLYFQVMIKLVEKL